MIIAPAWLTCRTETFRLDWTYHIYYDRGINRLHCKPRISKIGPSMRQIFALIVAFFSITAVSAAVELPNILWITTEDMGPHLGCYGDKYAQSPTLEALAARSFRYTNACSNAPVCAPARTTIISGLYPPSTGAEHMRSETRLPAGFRMFPQYLRDAGYYCTNNSKEDYNLVKPGRGGLARFAESSEQNVPVPFDPVWDASSRQAHWKNRREDQPFFAVFNHTITHESQIRNEIAAKDQVHDPAKVRIPAYHPDAPEVRRDWAQYYDRITMMDAEVAQDLKQLEAAGLGDDTIVFFFSDHGSGMPRNKRWLYRSGLSVPMIVYFPPKWRHLAPKGYAQGKTSDRLVSFIDLAPTILSLAGIEAPDWMQGGAFAGKFQVEGPEYSYGFRARMDERYDLSRSVRDKRYNYVRNYMPHRDYAQNLSYMFQTPTTRVWHRLFGEGKLNAAQSAFWQQKPPEELYDLETDPEEIHNLASSPDHADLLARMRKAHRDWEHEIKDVSFLSEWEMHKRSKGTTPYEMGHYPKQYDFDAIFAAAEMASSLDANKLPDIVRLLNDKDSGVRYWGAIGLLAHEQAGIAAGHDALVTALGDESPIVRIIASEALGRFGNATDAAAALEVLLKYAGPESNYYLAISAWNGLDYLDDRARPALPQLKAIEAHRTNVPPRIGEYTVRLKNKTLSDLE